MTLASTLPRAAAAIAFAVFLTACGNDEDPAASPADDSASASPSSASPSASSSSPAASTPRQTGPLRVADTVATGLSAPWGLAFLPDGSALISERDKARIVRVTSDGEVTEAGAVPGVDPGGEGGLLGIAVSPDFAKDASVFAYYTASEDNRLAKMTYDAAKPAGQRLSPPQTILTGIEKASIHNGGRIAFGPDGHLYVSTGDASQTDTAQDEFSLNGKILRVTKTGDPAPGNPSGSPVYSRGHRNVQGLAWDASGKLWATEFGQDTWDELNRITAGGNYGWPTVEGPAKNSRFVAPQATWKTDDASPSGLAIRGGVAYLAALGGQRLWTVPIQNGKAGKPKALFTSTYGRLRTVATAPDGSLWLITSNTDGRGDVRSGDDRILRLVGG